jgi:hypothetical protein
MPHLRYSPLRRCTLLREGQEAGCARDEADSEWALWDMGWSVVKLIRRVSHIGRGFPRFMLVRDLMLAHRRLAQWKVKCNAVTDAMKVFTRAYVTILAGGDVLNPNIGTGTFLDLNGVALLTCEHVARGNPSAYFGLGSKRRFLPALESKIRAAERSFTARDPAAGNGIFRCRDRRLRIDPRDRERLQRPKTRLVGRALAGLTTQPQPSSSCASRVEIPAEPLHDRKRLAWWEGSYEE